ncbi:MAG: protein kinase [Planctomycetota bacterium]|nr:protein kinase [Planctomycetota bacterium]
MGQVPHDKSKEQLFDSLADRETTALPSSTIDAQQAGDDQRVPADSASHSANSALEMFGRYQLSKLLGEGNMGSVYLAEDTVLQRQVAIKIPKFGTEPDPVLQERFNREARAAALLSHSNICPVFDVGEINGQQYITMAYVKGRPLSDFVDSDNPAPADQAAILICRLAHALNQAHSQGVIHRDLKPANIIVDEQREPILMDFGIARQLRSDDIRLTSTGAILGSPAYMSPEQAEGQQHLIGTTSDIYSLGVILYELLTGTTPFRGSIVSVLSQIVDEQSASKPSVLREDLDPKLDFICWKMMSKKIIDRYQSMAEVYNVLADWLAGHGLPQQPNIPTNLSAFDAKKAIRDVRLEKLVRYKKHIQSLLEQGQNQTALNLLKKMAKLKDARYSEYADWARREAVKTQTSIRESKQPYRLQPASKITRSSHLLPTASTRREASRVQRTKRLGKRAIAAVLFVIAIGALTQLEVPSAWRRNPAVPEEPTTTSSSPVTEQDTVSTELQVGAPEATVASPQIPAQNTPRRAQRGRGMRPPGRHPPGSGRVGPKRGPPPEHKRRGKHDPGQRRPPLQGSQRGGRLGGRRPANDRR